MDIEMKVTLSAAEVLSVIQRHMLTVINVPEGYRLVCERGFYGTGECEGRIEKIPEAEVVNADVHSGAVAS